MLCSDVDVRRGERKRKGMAGGEGVISFFSLFPFFLPVPRIGNVDTGAIFQSLRTLWICMTPSEPRGDTEYRPFDQDVRFLISSLIEGQSTQYAERMITTSRRLTSHNFGLGSPRPAWSRRKGRNLHSK